MVSPHSGKNSPTDRSRGAHEPHSELSSIDFSAADVSRALAECAGLVEVREVSSGIGSACEEVAVLYANGDTREAEVLLESVLADDSQAAGEGLWMMLLDLYQLTGQRERFESRVLDYATRFERSPPPWVNLSASVPRARSNVAPLVNLTGALSGGSAAQFDQLFVIGQKSGAIRIDLRRVRSVDDAGCALFLGVIRKLHAERVRVSLLNCGQLVAMLDERVEPGHAEQRETWLLLLELLQHAGEHERFEARALDYAITFEESPPSWEPVAHQEVAATSAGSSARGDDTVVFEGELTSGNCEGIRKLAAYASGHNTIEVDCARLRRMDFVTAGTLFNVLSTLQGQGKKVTLQNVNAMVAGLLRVMSVDQVARVVLRT